MSTGKDQPKVKRRTAGLIAAAMFTAAALGFSIRPSGIHDAPPVVPEAVAGTATTATLAPAWNWLIPTGTICVEVRGSVYATQAALDIYYHTDAKTLPARSNCIGYPRTRIIKLVPRDFGAEAACAATSGTTWYESTVRGFKTHTLSDPTIWYNTNPKYLKSCFGTAFAARHVWVHEMMHALGAPHNYGIPSVVAAQKAGYTDYSWKYDVTTSFDRSQANKYY